MKRGFLQKKLPLAVVFLLLLTSAMAQEINLTGVVKDSNGQAMPGVSIGVKGTSNGVMTDADGKFALNASPGNVLVFSFIGYKTQEVTVGTQAFVTITLEEETKTLDEYVVIGYGSIRKGDVTTSISSVKQEDLKTLPVAGIDQAIQGRLAGVTVTTNGGQPGGGVSVRVRGITSVNGNEPLYVIDGVQMGGAQSSLDMNFLGGGSGQTGQSALATLNQADIETIDVLKDASAQAIYGSRAANGVVLITTKKGKAGQGKIAYDGYYGIKEIPKKLPVMNLRQFAQYQNDIIGEINTVTGNNQLLNPEFANPSLLGEGTDWQDEVYQTGAVSSHNLSFSGGHDKTTYFFSGSYFKEEGTLIETNFERFTLRGNIDHEIKKWLKVGFSTNLLRSDQKIGLTDGFDAITSTVLYNSPASPVKDVYGNYVGQTNIGGSLYGVANNPVAVARFRDVRNVTSRAFGGLYSEIKFFEGLSLRSELNYDFSLMSGKAFQPLIENGNTTIVGPSRLREQRNNSLYWAVKNYLNYTKSFGKHNIYATLGHEAQASVYDYIQANRNNLILNLPSLQAGDAENQGIAAGAGEWAMESYFFRVNYSFDNRYAISPSIRRDGSSAFGPNNRWGTFAGISASWTVTNESFAKDIDVLNFLKVRGGIGSVGNQEVGRNNSYSANVNLIAISPFGNGSMPDNVPNPNLSWESVVTYNAGIDATLFNMLDVTVDVYKKVTNDMLLSAQLGLYSGIGTSWDDIKTPITNDGQITNKGIDISLSTTHNIIPDLQWSSTLVFTHYKNTLDYINSSNANIRGEFDEYGERILVALSQKGYPVGSFYGYRTDGLFTSMEQLNNGMDWGLDVKPDGQWLGDVRYKDLNDDGVIDELDVEPIGNPNPKFTLGFTNNFTYKGFDLSVFLYASYGGDILNYARLKTEGMRNQFENQLTSVNDRYTATNTNTDMPRYNQWHNNNSRISDRYIEDGSYLRIQNVTLGYNLPKTLLQKIGINTARVYVSGQNLKTFTKYSGYDPELGSFNNSAIMMNIDNGRYPLPKTYMAGINIEF